MSLGCPTQAVHAQIDAKTLAGVGFCASHSVSMSKTDPHPSLRWIVRMPFDRCGAVWRIRVPESPCRYTTVDVYDHQHGGSQELSLIAARSIRDELAADMPLPYPVTSMVRQWRNGEFAVQFRFEKKASGECWSAAYQRLDLKTYKARAAMVSRSVQAYGSEFAREAVEVAWREAVTEQARLVDQLVRQGVPIFRHGATIDAPLSARFRVRVNAAIQRSTP